MSQDFIIRTGDVVVCIDDSLPDHPHRLQLLCKARLRRGSLYRVTKVMWLWGERGLHLDGLDHRPTDGFQAIRFRKVLSGDQHAQLLEEAQAHLSDHKQI